MKREIKFRVWDVLDSCFKEIEWGFNKNKSIIYYDAYEKCFVQNYNRYIFQQYTGLKDKNGREIYEGDVVKYNPDKPINRVGVIEFSDYYHGWSIRDNQCYPHSEYGVYSLESPFLSFNDVEIIGNIFENPELLEKK